MNRLKSIYINNYKCLQNFELNLDGVTDVLLLAKNGMGKSSVLSAFRILRRIALGENSVSRLFSKSDFAFGNQAVPIRFKVVLATDRGEYEYELTVAVEYGYRLFISSETLSLNKTIIMNRSVTSLLVDDMFILPWIKEAKEFCSILVNWILIMPIPVLMTAGTVDSGKLNYNCGNFISWLKNLLAENPAGYDDINREFAIALPDYSSFAWNDPVEESRDNLYLTFGSDEESHKIAFGDLSDGEKVSVLGATIIALSYIRPGFLCFWDEPDNFLAVSEVQSFITRLRKYLRIKGCQLVLSSHNVETIRTIGIDSTRVLYRASHHEPTRMVSCSDKFTSDEDRETYIHNVLSGELYVD